MIQSTLLRPALKYGSMALVTSALVAVVAHAEPIGKPVPIVAPPAPVTSPVCARWESDLITSEHGLRGPFVLTSLNVPVDPTAPQTQHTMLLGTDGLKNSWLPAESFHGELFVPDGAWLKLDPRFTPNRNGVLYSGRRCDR
jgi:hypothetical protein